MKKKVKKLIDWFYDETDRGEDNISGCKNLYELVEKLQYRIDDLENEHMLVLRELGQLRGQLNQEK